VILDLGDQPFRSCPQCRRRHWTREDAKLEKCKRDDAPLEPPRTGRRQQWSSYPTKSEAQAAADASRTELRKKTCVIRRTETVAEHFASWLPSIRGQVRPSTFENYRVNFEAHVRPGDRGRG
jgi:hypothetical protein